MTPLHYLGEFLRDLLGAIPLAFVRLLFLAVPVVVLIWVLRLPRRETSPAESRNPLANLKVGAALALVIQIMIYALI